MTQTLINELPELPENSAEKLKNSIDGSFAGKTQENRQNVSIYLILKKYFVFRYLKFTASDIPWFKCFNSAAGSFNFWVCRYFNPVNN